MKGRWFSTAPTNFKRIHINKQRDILYLSTSLQVAHVSKFAVCYRIASSLISFTQEVTDCRRRTVELLRSVRVTLGLFRSRLLSPTNNYYLP